MIEFIYAVPPKDYFKEEERCGYTITSEMKKVHATQLEIFQLFHNICEGNNLNYWVDGGTLLGAVRHKGFIPWDDDIDVCMLREDYDKFLEVCASGAIKEPYFLQNFVTQPLCEKVHSRLRVDGTAMVTDARQLKYPKYVHQGIFIDIYPFDKTEEGYTLDEDPEYLSVIESLASVNETLDSKNWRALSLKSLKEALRAMDGVMKKHTGSSTKVIQNKTDGPEWANKTKRNISNARTRELVDFEYIKVYIPKNWKKILSQEFGDWETPVQAPTRHNAIYFSADKDYSEITMHTALKHNVKGK